MSYSKRTNTENPPIETVPSIASQAEALGWKHGIYSFGKAEQPGIDYFNPGLVERHDGLWLLVRRADMNVMNGFGMNGVVALKLDETGTIPQHGKVLEWPNALPGQQFEDARAVYIPHMKQVAVSATTFQWFGEDQNPAWTGPIQILSFHDADWNCKVVHFVPFETNATELKTVPPEHAQKNWTYFFRHDRLHLHYKADPWVVAVFKDDWHEGRMVHVGPSVTWPYGVIRGGTPPVDIDGMMVTFFHSSMPWWGRYRRYYMGALAFRADAPFTPISITMEPLITGSTAEHWSPRKPACIFPCGAVIRGSDILISAGVNDLRSCHFTAPISSIMQRMVRIGGSTPVAGVTMTDAKKEAARARMAHARTARGKAKAARAR